MDPKLLFKAFLNSNIATNIYKGIAYFIDNPIELYYALYQLSSIRTILGEYAYFILYIYDKDIGKPIFPSDFIYFKYIDYYRYYYKFNENNPDYIIYIGRIKVIGKDYTTVYIYKEGNITLVINEYIDIK